MKGGGAGSRSEGKVLEVAIRGLGKEPAEHPIGNEAEPGSLVNREWGQEVPLQTRRERGVWAWCGGSR